MNAVTKDWLQYKETDGFAVSGFGLWVWPSWLFMFHELWLLFRKGSLLVVRKVHTCGLVLCIWSQGFRSLQIRVLGFKVGVGFGVEGGVPAQVIAGTQVLQVEPFVPQPGCFLLHRLL